MKRVLMLGGMLLLLVGASGCSSNPRDEEINKTLNNFTSAGDELGALKSSLNRSLEKLDTDLKAKARTDDKLNASDLKDALGKAEKLRETGKKLVEDKGQLERLKDRTDSAERDELAKQYRQRFEEVINRFNKTQAELETTLVLVKERSEPSAYEALRQALKNSKEEFEGLTKQR